MDVRANEICGARQQESQNCLQEARADQLLKLVLLVSEALDEA